MNAPPNAPPVQELSRAEELAGVAELAVIAAMLSGNEAIGRACKLLKSSDFYRIGHQKIFEAIVALHSRNERADYLTVCEELRKRNDLGVAGGPAAVSEVNDAVGVPENLEQYARIILAAAANRRARRFATELHSDIEADPDRALETLLARRDRLGALGHAPGGGMAVEYLDLPAILAKGIPPVPWIIEGWVAEQDIVLISGDGGIGKSTTVGALVMAVAAGGSWCGIPATRSGPVLLFDEEQSEREVARLYQRLGAPCDNLRIASQQGMNLTSGDGLARLEHELREHRPLLVILDSVQQLFAGVDGNSAADVARVYAELFRLRRMYGCAFILIGHLRKPPSDGQMAKLHLVHGSVAFGTQASTVWVATQPACNLMDLVQVKRRDGERTSLRIRYTTEGPNDPIVLTSEGPVDAQETITERAQDFVAGYLAEHGTSRAGWIVTAGAAEKVPFPERSVKRALAHLLKLGTVERLKRGYYGLANAPGEKA